MIVMGKKIWGMICVLLLCSSLAFSQNLVEAAKKEKERRAKLKGKSGHVITNEDLKKVKKNPKVVTNEDLKKGQRQAGVSVPAKETSKENTSEKAEKQDTESPPETKSSPVQGKIDEKKHLESLELEYEKAKAQVEMLTSKMNGLFMKYYSPDNKTPKVMIQSEISQTALQLQKARDDEEKAKKELEDYKSKKRE